MPGTNMLLVDFNTMRWSADEQERLARTAAMLPSQPLVVFIGFPDWCGENLPVVRLENESVASAVHRTRGLAYERCRLMLANASSTSMVPDPVEASLARIARHYGQLYLSMYTLLTPLIAAHHPSFWPPNRFTVDGAHGYRRGPHHRSAYYDAAAAALFHLLYSASQSLESAVQPVGGE